MIYADPDVLAALRTGDNFKLTFHMTDHYHMKACLFGLSLPEHFDLVMQQ